MSQAGALSGTIGMEFHPVADIFPLMRGREFDELAADIARHGQRDPIWTKGGLIIDGRNRYRACRELGVEPVRREYDGDDLIAFVVSLNLHRRHLNESQRAMVAAKLANLPHGQKKADTAIAVSQGDAGTMLKVSEDSIQRAGTVLETGAPELVDAVNEGRVSVNAAKDVATLPQAEQQEIVAKGERQILEAAKNIRFRKAEARRKERIDNIVEISKGNRDLGTDRKFPIIYADPPWRYETPPMGGSNRSIENHYPTMTLEEICALPVKDLATDDALLYLWATSPKLAECMKVIEAWGFVYRTSFVWVKDKIGMGYHARNQHELLLVAKRGELPPPPPTARQSSVIHAPRTEHSAKPVEFHVLIEGMYPELPKIELFCRSARHGWEVWGNQAGAA